MPRHRDSGKGKLGGEEEHRNARCAEKQGQHTEPEVHLLGKERGGQALATNPVKDGLEGETGSRDRQGLALPQQLVVGLGSRG